MVLWVLIFAMLCTRAVLILWHAFLFLGLTPVDFFPLLFPLYLVVSTFCKSIFPLRQLLPSKLAHLHQPRSEKRFGMVTCQSHIPGAQKKTKKTFALYP
jgi:hypothetical protein